MAWPASMHSEEYWESFIEKTAASVPKRFPEYAFVHPRSQEFARSFDHTLLKTDATPEQIDKLCDEARNYNFAAVCVRLEHVARAVANLRSSKVLVACVVGFHEGTQPTAAKVQEALAAVEAGAAELDMVLNHVALSSRAKGSNLEVLNDILAVRQACPAPKTRLKVILETSRLDQRGIVAGSMLSVAAGADFVKTSTGFDGRGATLRDIQIMKRLVWPHGVRVKASGGIKTWTDAEEMMRAGADRIGASASVDIIQRADAEYDSDAELMEDIRLGR